MCCEWKNIETAPKDGTRIVLVRLGTPAFAFAGEWKVFYGVGQWMSSEHVAAFSAHSAQPTHWMPLPPAPQGKED